MKNATESVNFFLGDILAFAVTHRTSLSANRELYLSLYWMSHPRLLFLKTLPPRSKLLDLGMANGGMANVKEFLDPPRPDIDIYGIDLKRHDPNFYHLYRQVDFLDFETDPLPFPEGYFNGIIASHFVEHLKDHKRFLERTIPLLSPGGRIYLETPTKISLVLPHGKEFAKHGLPIRPASFWEDGTHWAVPDFSDLEKTAARTGLITIQRGLISNPYIEQDLICLGFHEASEEIATYGFWSRVLWCQFLILQKPDELQRSLLSLSSGVTPRVTAMTLSPPIGPESHNSRNEMKRDTPKSTKVNDAPSCGDPEPVAAQSRPIGRLFIFDQNLCSLQGHHLSYSSLLSQAGRQVGIETFVLANSNLQIDRPETNLIPVLSKDYWQELRFESDMAPPRHLMTQATEFQNTLLQLAKRFSWGVKDVLFLPYANMIHPFSLRRLHEALTPHIPRTVLLFRRELSEQAAHARMPVREAELTLTLSLWDLLTGPGGPKVRLFTDSEVLTTDYMARVGHFFQTAPIPVHPELYATQPRPYACPLNLVYVGDARTEKGFHLLPAVAHHLKSQLASGKIRMIVQSNFNIPGGEPGIPEARQQLASFPNVSLVSGPLDVNAYNQLIRSAHIILLPYRARDYHARTSGILAEAIHAAVPVVVPKGTWLSEQLANSGAGVTFRSDSPGDLCAAVTQLISQYAEYAERAFIRRSSFVEFHKPARLLKFICGAELLPF